MQTNVHQLFINLITTLDCIIDTSITKEIMGGRLKVI